MIADFHNDFLTEGKGSLSLFGTEAECMVCALFRGSRREEEIFQILRRFAEEKAANQFLGLEDVGYLTDENYDAIMQYRPVYASLTWNYETAFASGCLSAGGLKKEGKRLVKKLAEDGIFIDCAHLNAESFCDLLDCEVRILDSHTCSAALCRHPRNLEDWQMSEITARGGLIGIAFVSDFLKDGGADMHDVFLHADHCVQKFGIASVCFGSDFYGTQNLPAGLTDYAQAENLYNDFAAAGYKDRDIERIFYVNLHNFLYNHEKI